MGVPDAGGVNIHLSIRGIFMQISRRVTLVQRFSACLIFATDEYCGSSERPVARTSMRLRMKAAKHSPVARVHSVLINKHFAPRSLGTPNSKVGSISGDPEINQQREEKREKRDSVRFRAPKEGIHRLSAVKL